MVEKITSEAQYDSILKDNKAVFADFYADWCGPCKMVSPLVDKISQDITDVKFIKINVDELPQIAQRYGIMSIPTLLCFKDGALAEQNVGFRPEEDLRAMVAKIR
jgi:thioredoxin 1